MSAADGLDQLADRLYALPPADFVPARDEAAAVARSGGDRARAADIAKFRRPTVAAWLVNLLALRHGERLDELLALGVEMRSAQGDLRGPALRELSTRRRAMIADLVGQACDLAVASGATRSGLPVAEVEATLTAAVADGAIADQVRGGHLQKSVHYDGFGETPRPHLHAVPTNKDPDPAVVRQSAPPPPPPPDHSDLIRAADAAREAVAAAESHRDEMTAAASVAIERLTDIEARLLELRRERVNAHAAAATAEEARLAAVQALDAARRASTVADRALARANVRASSRGNVGKSQTRARNHDTDG